MSAYRMTLPIVKRKAEAVGRMYGAQIGAEKESGVIRVYRAYPGESGISALHTGDLNSAYAFLDGMMKGWELTHG